MADAVLQLARRAVAKVLSKGAEHRKCHTLPGATQGPGSGAPSTSRPPQTPEVPQLTRQLHAVPAVSPVPAVPAVPARSSGLIASAYSKGSVAASVTKWPAGVPEGLAAEPSVSYFESDGTLTHPVRA